MAYLTVRAKTMTTEDEEALKTLLRWAGRRPTPPEEVADAVYQHCRRAWLAQVERRNALRRGLAWAAGLVVFVMSGWGGWQLYSHPALATVPPGQAVLITHTLWHPTAGRRAGALYEGDVLETRATGTSLRRADGNELTLGEHTRVSFTSPTTVRLWYGGLYVQTSGASAGRGLVVSTELGSIEHLGTQFMARQNEDALLVAVRDGRAELHYPQHETVVLEAGQAARVDPSGALQRWELTGFDSVWDWADVLATPLVIEDQSLYDVLSRIAQRSGLVLRFATPEAESEARRLTLHGEPLALQPRYALTAVLATTSLSGTTEGREILVSTR
jgi:ferric-dicitrate binding protein FerR (iron transport regulator)